jgi:hypothetical protein
MKPTTKITIGIKHVGAPMDAPEFFTGEITECLMFMAEYLAKRSMAVRFDMVIHRNEVEARKALTGQRQSAAHGLEDLQARLAEIMANGGEAENVLADEN